VYVLFIPQNIVIRKAFQLVISATALARRARKIRQYLKKSGDEKAARESPKSRPHLCVVPIL
jgi:hypothetical protein